MRKSTRKLFVLSCILLAAMQAHAVPGTSDEPTAAPTAATQTRTITGRVVDGAGQPVVGVAVSIEGTTRGGITDATGAFSIAGAPAEGRLAATFIGYETVYLPLDGRPSYEIVINESSTELDQVVVVGYGTQIRRNVATAISSVDGSKLADIPVQSPLEALVGQVAGLDLQQRSGAPGEAPMVRIRGVGSISSGNGPLFVIDGYPTNDAALFNAINPNDIETIDVMKDAASAAIYGSRAGNGVILVTTKRGSRDRTTFNFNMNVGFEQIMHKYPVMNAEEFAEMAIEEIENRGLTPPEILTNPSMWHETDWQDVIFRTGINQSYNLSANGGSEKVQYALSGGYSNLQGIVHNTYNQRYNARVMVDAQPTDWLRMGVNLQPSFSKQRVQQLQGGNTTAGEGILAEALSMPPILPVWRADGDYFNIPQEGGFGSNKDRVMDREFDKSNYAFFNQQLSNPLSKLDGFIDIYRRIRTTGSAYVEIVPVRNLTLRSSVNLGYGNTMRDYYVEGFVTKGNGDTGNISTPNLARITAQRQNTTNVNLYWSNTATYNLLLNDVHDFTFLLGYDAAEQSNYYTRVEPRTDASTPIAFNNTTVKSVEGAVLRSGTSSRTAYLFDAVFGRVNYNYKSKYLFSASLRQDRSSRFGPDNRAGLFPSVSAAWNIQSEPFMQSLPLFSALKIRASYGETGNDQLPGYYPWLTTMESTYYAVGAGGSDDRVVGYRPGGFNNANLGWEKNKQFDFGLDIAILKNRISLVVDYYNRRSNTVLSTDIPNINGKSNTVMLNAGEVENKGWEFALNTVNLTGALTWRSNLNISMNRNKLLSLRGNMQGLDLTGDRRNYVGRPFGDFYMLIVDGTFNTPEELANGAKNGTQAVGDLRFRDVSGPEGKPDGKIEAAYDQVYVGNAQPDMTFGFSNSFIYKGFDLNVMLDGQVGGYVYRYEERALSLSRSQENASKEAVGRWRSAENPGNGRYHRAGNTVSPNIGANTRYLYPADFLRVRTVTLGYTLPKSLTEKLSIQSARLFLTSNNLHIFTDVGGFNNPQGSSVAETASNGTQNRNWGYNAGAYPLSRTLSFGLNVVF